MTAATSGNVAVSSADSVAAVPNAARRYFGQLIGVALNPALEFGDRDQDELPSDHDLELGLHLSLEVVDADPQRRGGLTARERVAGDRRQWPSLGAGHQISFPKSRVRSTPRSTDSRLDVAW